MSFSNVPQVTAPSAARSRSVSPAVQRTEGGSPSQPEMTLSIPSPKPLGVRSRSTSPAGRIPSPVSISGTAAEEFPATSSGAQHMADSRSLASASSACSGVDRVRSIAGGACEDAFCSHPRAVESGQTPSARAIAKVRAILERHDSPAVESREPSTVGIIHAAAKAYEPLLSSASNRFENCVLESYHSIARTPEEDQEVVSGVLKEALSFLNSVLVSTGIEGGLVRNASSFLALNRMPNQDIIASVKMYLDSYGINSDEFKEALIKALSTSQQELQKGIDKIIDPITLIIDHKEAADKNTKDILKKIIEEHALSLLDILKGSDSLEIKATHILMLVSDAIEGIRQVDSVGGKHRISEEQKDAVIRLQRRVFQESIGVEYTDYRPLELRTNQDNFVQGAVSAMSGVYMAGGDYSPLDRQAINMELKKLLTSYLEEVVVFLTSDQRPCSLLNACKEILKEEKCEEVIFAFSRAHEIGLSLGLNIDRLSVAFETGINALKNALESSLIGRFNQASPTLPAGYWKGGAPEAQYFFEKIYLNLDQPASKELLLDRLRSNAGNLPIDNVVATEVMKICVKIVNDRLFEKATSNR